MEKGYEKLTITLRLLLAGLLTVSMLIGCGGDEEIAQATFVRADPPNEAVITYRQNIALTFDNTPTNVTVSTKTVTGFNNKWNIVDPGTDGRVSVESNTVTITGPFVPGALVLTVTWAAGTQTLSYTVTGPD